VATFTHNRWVERRAVAHLGSSDDLSRGYFQLAVDAAAEAGLSPTGKCTGHVRDSDPSKGETPDGVIITIDVQCEDHDEKAPAMVAAFSPDELLREALFNPGQVCVDTGRHTFLPADSERFRTYPESFATCLACGAVVTAYAIATSAGLAWCACSRWEQADLIKAGCIHGV
jgi:hypothetical protein